MEAMPIPESSIAQVVTEASKKMHDPKYISSEVDRFIRGQPAISQLVMAASAELTVEGVVMVLFHAALLARSMALATGNAPRLVTARDLEHAGHSTPTVESLAEDEPHLASYVASNVEEGSAQESGGAGGRSGQFDAPLARTLLARVARALVG